MKVFYENKNIVIENDEKVKIYINPENNSIEIDNFKINVQGEFEKDGVLILAKSFGENLFYTINTDNKEIAFLFTDNFEIKENISDFLGNIDLLLIPGSKKSHDLFENIEANIVIPFGEGKDIFLNSFGQSIEEITDFVIKKEIDSANTIFVNLAEKE